MGGIPQRDPIRIPPSGWNEPRNPIPHPDPPDTRMHGCMMSTAQEDQVVQIRAAARGPPDHMVRLTPLRWFPAARHDTPAVADREGLALRRGRQPLGVSDVQHGP